MRIYDIMNENSMYMYGAYRNMRKVYQCVVIIQRKTCVTVNRA